MDINTRICPRNYSVLQNYKQIIVRYINNNNNNNNNNNKRICV